MFFIEFDLIHPTSTILVTYTQLLRPTQTHLVVYEHNSSIFFGKVIKVPKHKKALKYNKKINLHNK